MGRLLEALKRIESRKAVVAWPVEADGWPDSPPAADWFGPVLHEGGSEDTETADWPTLGLLPSGPDSSAEAAAEASEDNVCEDEVFDAPDVGDVDPRVTLFPVDDLWPPYCDKLDSEPTVELSPFERGQGEGNYIHGQALTPTLFQRERGTYSETQDVEPISVASQQVNHSAEAPLAETPSAALPVSVGAGAAAEPVIVQPWTITVPFAAPAERPYRGVCENILARLPESGSSALALAWADNDLDHSPLVIRLARVMAERLDDPVLLLDVGAERRPASGWRVSAESRVPSALAGHVSWRELIVQTDTAGLCVLPSAAGDFDADSISVARLLDDCRQEFGLVIVAGGPASSLPENLLAACDSAVLLVEMRYTSATVAVAAARQLTAGGVELLGCVLTGVEGMTADSPTIGARLPSLET